MQGLRAVTIPGHHYFHLGRGMDVKWPGWPTGRTALPKIPPVPRRGASHKPSTARDRCLPRWGLQYAAWLFRFTFLVEHVTTAPPDRVSKRVSEART